MKVFESDLVALHRIYLDSSLVPVDREHCVDHAIKVVAINKLGLAQDALLGKSKAFGNGTTLAVFDRGPDLDPVEPPDCDRMINHKAHGASHQPPALMVGVEPVAQHGSAVPPVNLHVADHSCDAALANDGAVKAFVGRDLPFTAVDELEGILKGLCRRPCQPLS